MSKKKVSLDTANSVPMVAASAGVAPIAILPVLELLPQLKPFEDAAANLEAQSARALIDSEEKYQKGTDFLTVCDEQWDQLETLRTTVKKPIDDYGKFIQSIFVPIQNRVKAARGTVNSLMLAFYKAEEARRKKEAEEQQKRNEEAAQALASQAEAKGDTATAQAILDVATSIPVSMKPLRLGATNSFGKSTGIAKRWTASVEKPMEVLQAIIDGKLPISLIDWKQVELNKAANTIKVEKVVFGLKVFQSENLQQR